MTSPPPLLQSVIAAAAGTNPYTLAFNKPVTLASALVGLFCWGAGNVTIQQLGDNLNGVNSWTRVGQSTNTSRTVGVIFLNNTKAGPLTLSMQLSGTIAQVAFSLFEFGYAAVGSDVFLPGGNATATTTPSVGPLNAISAPTDLVVAAIKGTGMPTQDTPGWTGQHATQFSSEFIFPASVAPITASWVMATSAPYAAIIAALKIAPYAITPPGSGLLAGSNPLAGTSSNGQQSSLAGSNPGSIIVPGAPLGALAPANPFGK